MFKKRATPLGERVRQGAEYLDEVAPDWFAGVDTATIDLNSNRYCIAGQVFGDYTLTPFARALRAKRRVHRMKGQYIRADRTVVAYTRQARSYGFVADGHEVPRAEDLWRDAIMRRRNLAAMTMSDSVTGGDRR